MEIRQPAVAGTFYNADPVRLAREVDSLLEEAAPGQVAADRIKALVVPHAGYIYSGPVAATAYRLLASRRRQIRRVVLLGPSHRVAFRGLAWPAVDGFRTPLGQVNLDHEAIDRVAGLPGVVCRDDVHAQEHSLEVQLPFLQAVLDNFRLVPLVVGEASSDEVGQVLERLWGGDETLFVISSDLSHFLSYELARQTDRHTSQLIERKQDSLAGDQACGCRPLNALLHIAGQKGLQVQTLDLRNSGDTAGSRDRVVGYGSYVICQ